MIVWKCRRILHSTYWENIIKICGHVVQTHGPSIKRNIFVLNKIVLNLSCIIFTIGWCLRLLTRENKWLTRCLETSPHFMWLWRKTFLWVPKNGKYVFIRVDFFLNVTLILTAFFWTQKSSSNLVSYIFIRHEMDPFLLPQRVEILKT